MKIQLSELIVEYLQRLGVDTIFGMPGAHILPIYDALYSSGIRTVLVKHEQGAAFMACGYARVSGRIGVCIATAGPGASNLVTGIAHAYADKLPVLALTGEAPTHIFGRGGLQESSGEGGSIDQTALFCGVARYHKLIERTDYLSNVLNQAMRKLLADVAGPVVLSMPVNVQTEWVDVSTLDRLPSLKSSSKLQVARETLNECAALLRQARRPVVLAGYGCLRSAQAHTALREFSERWNIPVASSLKGKGALDERSELSLGCLGVTSAGYALHYLMQDADLLILLGAGFNERTSYVWKKDLLSRKIIQVDHDVRQLEKVLKVDLAIQSEVGEFLRALDAHCAQERLEAKAHPDLTAFKARIDAQSRQDGTVIFDTPFDLVKTFFAALEQHFSDGIVLIDDNIIFAQNFYRVANRDIWVPNTGISSLGHAIPAAIGARFAVDKPIFAVLGDGGFQMCCMEIMTAVNYSLALNIVVFNNRSLGLIRKNQHQQYARRFLDCDFENPNFALLAQSFGIRHFKIENSDDCRRVFEQADFYHGINLIELMLDREAYPNYSSYR